MLGRFDGRPGVSEPDVSDLSRLLGLLTVLLWRRSASDESPRGRPGAVPAYPGTYSKPPDPSGRSSGLRVLPPACRGRGAV